MVLRFVPDVGTLLASVFPIIIAVAVGDGWTLALLTIAIVVLTETIVGHVRTPCSSARRPDFRPWRSWPPPHPRQPSGGRSDWCWYPITIMLLVGGDIRSPAVLEALPAPNPR